MVYTLVLASKWLGEKPAIKFARAPNIISNKKDSQILSLLGYHPNLHHQIELWSLIERRRFKSPKGFANYLRGQGLFFRGLPYGDLLRVELHEGIAVSPTPMLIKSVIPKGRRTYRPCVHFPNGNVQELHDFIAHWKLQQQALKER